MYEVLKKAQALVEEIGAVSSIYYNICNDGNISIEGVFANGDKLYLSLAICHKEAADE